MTQEDAMNMNNEQAIQILTPFCDMLRDQNGCPISDAYFAMKKAIEALKERRPMFYICKTVDQEKLKDMEKNFPPMFVTPGTEKIELIRELHWISCSERLPEYADFYLTSTEHNSVYCDFYDGYRFQRTEKVIAWMPLPEPYMENEL